MGSLKLIQNPDNSITAINDFGHLQHSTDLKIWTDAENPTNNTFHEDHCIFRIRY